MYGVPQGLGFWGRTSGLGILGFRIEGWGLGAVKILGAKSVTCPGVSREMYFSNQITGIMIAKLMSLDMWKVDVEHILIRNTLYTFLSLRSNAK